MSEVINHVWQSTLFAVAIAFFALAFRRNRAQVRYLLWLSASVKFLLPFSLLMMMGSRVEWAPVHEKLQPPPRVRAVIMETSRPFPELRETSTRSAHGSLAVSLFGVWIAGFGFVALMRFRGWRRVRAVLRSSTPIGLLQGMSIRSSPGLIEPGVVGLFRPVLVLPQGLADCLTARQLKAVVAHELCHARRHDNLTAAVHMIVEAVFWFHPLVWWIGAQLLDERERACDEAVLRLGNEPSDYAQGIIGICRRYIESPSPLASGVTGSNLKRRIQNILAGPAIRNLSPAKKLALTAGAAAAVVIPFAAGVAAPASKFEAASVKPCAAFRRVSIEKRQRTNFESQCTTVDRLIRQAFGLFAGGRMHPGSHLTITGGPTWTKSSLYQIVAKPSSPQSQAQMNGPMLQALLENRFKLKLHYETREIPVYALSAAAGGPKLDRFQGNCAPRDFDEPPSETDCATARGYGNTLDLKAAMLPDLCAGLSVLLDRPVVDTSGLAGRFDFHIELPAEDAALLNRPRSLPALSDPTTPPPPPILYGAMQTALRKLGLDLEPANAPGTFLVVDHIERPSAE
jgi:uncharacterized protein (TIGR03435 family)